MSTIDLEVQGMSCGSCVKHVTQALQALTGVSGVAVDLTSGHQPGTDGRAACCCQ